MRVCVYVCVCVSVCVRERVRERDRERERERESERERMWVTNSICGQYVLRIMGTRNMSPNYIELGKIGRSVVG